MSPRPKGETDGNLLRSVQRASALLGCLAAEGGLTAREASEALDLKLPTCYHLLNTLERERLVSRDANRRYWLGPRIAELHDAFSAQLAPDRRLLEGLDELSERTGETCYLGIWRNGEAVSVAVREGRRQVRVQEIHVGYSGHSYARALGRALLAFQGDETIERYLGRATLEPLTPHTATDPDRLRRVLTDVRMIGVAVESEEFAEGVCCVGAPVRDAANHPVAALSVSVPKARFDTDGPMLVEVVREVATHASERILQDEEPEYAIDTKELEG